MRMYFQRVTAVSLFLGFVAMPALGHGEVVDGIDRLLAGGKLAVAGNYFAGLAIEDCVLRSNAEWARIA